MLFKLSAAAKKKALEWATAGIDISMAVLANTPTTKYVEVLQAVFGYEEESEEEDTPDPPKTPKPPTPGVGDKDDDDDGSPSLKRARRSKKTVQTPSKLSYTFPNRYVLSDDRVRPFYPSSKNDAQERGIPARLMVDAHRDGQYKCRFDDMAPHFHMTPADPPCSFVTKGKASLGAHYRRVHLGHCLQCPICEQPERRYWQARGWVIHMEAVHANQSDEWYWDDSDEQPLFAPVPSE